MSATPSLLVPGRGGVDAGGGDATCSSILSATAFTVAALTGKLAVCHAAAGSLVYHNFTKEENGTSSKKNRSDKNGS